MTPSLCNGFCRALGRSLAVLRGGTKCFCGESSQMETLLRNSFSCFVPCPGDPSKLCGGLESYTAYRTMPGTGETEIEISDKYTIRLTNISSIFLNQ